MVTSQQLIILSKMLAFNNIYISDNRYCFQFIPAKYSTSIFSQKPCSFRLMLQNIRQLVIPTPKVGLPKPNGAWSMVQWYMPGKTSEFLTSSRWFLQVSFEVLTFRLVTGQSWQWGAGLTGQVDWIHQLDYRLDTSTGLQTGYIHWNLHCLPLVTKVIRLKFGAN